MNPYYFAYQLDTLSNLVCKAAMDINDLIGENNLFDVAKYNSFVLDSIYSKTHRNTKRYIQYYKNIPVNNASVKLNFIDGKVFSVVGRYYPNLNIDTSGMISKEAATKVVIANADYYPQFKDKIGPNYFGEAGTPKIDPDKKAVYYFFYVNKLARKPGQYFIDAIKGTLIRYVPDLENHLTDCYRCSGSSAVTLVCQDACDEEICTSFYDNVVLSVPTLYNGCATIYSDSCTTQSGIYRMASIGEGSHDTLIITGFNDFVNVYDASNYYQVFSPDDPTPVPYEIKYCYQDTLSKRNTIASSLYYGASVSHSYFIDKEIEYDLPIIIYSHVPGDPFEDVGNSAAWNPIKNRFEMGDGDEITMLAPVSVDIMAHEYAHRILYKTFEIGSHVTHSTVPHKYEASAIHEGVSDIFSVLTRRHAYDTLDWTIGSEVVIDNVSNLPRDLSQPENTIPPQALYYNDSAAYWDTISWKIYNHAGIIAKWFHLLSEGGTGFNFATDSINVQALGIDTAEMVLIGGLARLDSSNITVPTYEQFCQSMVDASQTISCNTRIQTLRAAKAVGLCLAIPGGKTEAIQDEELCFVDLRMRDNNNDIGQEPNYSACIDVDGGGWDSASPSDWENIWSSPDIWICPSGNECPPEEGADPIAVFSNRWGFRIYNAHPNLVSDPATLHLYYTMASTGEMWESEWVDNSYWVESTSCLVGDEITNSPTTIPPIDPQTYYTGWVNWSPPNFFDTTYAFYADPLICGLTPETDDEDGELKYEICLLARIESAADPIVGESLNIPIRDNVLNSNNIVTKNLFLLEPASGEGGGLSPFIPGRPSVIFIANNNDDEENLDILFDKFSLGSTKDLHDILEISFVLSPELWAKWESTGKQGDGVEIISNREVKITDIETAKLLNIPFDAGKSEPMAIKTTLLTNSGKQETLNFLPDNFSFRITHRSSDGSAINKPSNCLFKLENLNEQITISQNIFSELSIYPNPFNEQLTTQFFLEKEENVSIALYDTQGRLVKNILEQGILTAGKQQIFVESGDLINGVYFCVLSTNRQQMSQKVIKMGN